MDGEIAQWVYIFAAKSSDLSLIPRMHMVEEEKLTPDSSWVLWPPCKPWQEYRGAYTHRKTCHFFFFRKNCSWHKGYKHISTKVSYIVQDLMHSGSTRGSPEYSELSLPTAIIFQDNLSLTRLSDNMTLETPQLRPLPMTLVWVKSG